MIRTAADAKSQIIHLLLLISLVCWSTGGCSSETKADKVPPAITIERPSEQKSDQGLALLKIKVVAKQTEGTWTPGPLFLKMCQDREGKHELANILLDPQKTNDGSAYETNFPKPKTPGSYYLICELEENSSSARSGDAPLRRSESQRLKFEVGK